MNVEKRGSSYRVRKQVKGKSYSLTFDHKPTQKEVNERIANLCNASVTSQNAPNKSFSECGGKYIEAKSNVLSPSTIRSYKAMLKNLDDNFKELPLNSIGQIEVQDLINNMAKEKSPKTCRNYHALVVAIMQFYIPDFNVPTTLPQKVKNEDYIPTAEEVKKVLAIADGTKYWIPFMLGCYGFRRSEVLALTLDDIDFDTGLVHINKAMVYNDAHEWIIKTNKTTESQRDIVVSQDVLNRIKGQGNVYQGHPRKIIENLHSMQKKAGVPQFKFHSLRHFFATEISRVLPEEDWLRLGGWSSPYVAKKIYRHNKVDREMSENQKAAEQLSKLLN